MGEIIITIIAALAAYLWGSVSPARIIGARLLPAQDLSNTKVALPNSEKADIKYRGVSATSVGAKLGPKWGIVIGILDMLKALVPMGVCMWVFEQSALGLWLGVWIMIGHNWPIFYRFHGGRGQSVLIGALLCFSPLAPLITYPLGMAIGLLLLKDMFIAYTLGQFLLILWFAFLGTTHELLFAIAVNLIYVIAALPEAQDYMRARKQGHVGKVKSLSDVMNAHPAMGEKRFDRPES